MIKVRKVYFCRSLEDELDYTAIILSRISHVS